MGMQNAHLYHMHLRSLTRHLDILDSSTIHLCMLEKDLAFTFFVHPYLQAFILQVPSSLFITCHHTDILLGSTPSECLLWLYVTCYLVRTWQPHRKAVFPSNLLCFCPLIHPVTREMQPKCKQRKATVLLNLPQRSSTSELSQTFSRAREALSAAWIHTPPFSLPHFLLLCTFRSLHMIYLLRLISLSASIRQLFYSCQLSSSYR